MPEQKSCIHCRLYTKTPDAEGSAIYCICFLKKAGESKSLLPLGFLAYFELGAGFAAAGVGAGEGAGAGAGPSEATCTSSST